MKRVYICGVIMLLLIALSISSNIYISDKVEEMQKEITIACEHFTKGEYEKATLASIKAEEDWQEFSSHILFTGNREQIKDISSVLAEMKAFAFTEDSQFFSKFYTAFELLENYKDIQQLTVENIL